MNTVLTFLEANRQRLSLDRYGAGRMSYVMVTPRFRASSHVVFLLLPPGATEPALVAKVPRIGGASASLTREAANLRACQAARLGGFDSIPRVIAFEEFCGHPILVETALVGQPIDPAAIRRDLAGACAAVTAWLAEIQGAQPIATATGGFERLVEQPLQRLAEALSSAEDARLLERTRALVAPLRGRRLPLVLEHGDLSHPNVMRLRSGGVGVVDWELADPHGLPASDLFFFLTYAAFARRGARADADYVAAFHAAFFGRSAWARPYIRACAERLDLPPDTLTPLFVACWARYLSGLLLRLKEAGSGHTPIGAGTADWLRTNRYYALWRHTLDHAHTLDWHDLPPARSS